MRLDNEQVLAGALPKSGIVTSTARKIVLASSEVMDFGFEDIETVQMAELVLTLIDHRNSNTVTGLLAEGMMLETGFGGN